MLEAVAIGLVILLAFVLTVAAVWALSEVPEFSHDMPPELMGLKKEHPKGKGDLTNE